MVRKKHRYLLAEVVYEKNSSTADAIREAQIYLAIREKFEEAYGDYGIALVKKSLNVRYFTEQTRMLLVRIRRGAETMLSNVFLIINSICNTAVKIVTKHISGSIRCAQKYWIRHSRRALSRAIRSVSGDKERQALHQKISEINKAEFSDKFSISGNKAGTKANKQPPPKS